MAEDKVPMILCRIYWHAWETEMSYGQLYLSFFGKLCTAVYL